MKAAQSKCIDKMKFVIDAMMKARTQNLINNGMMDDEHLSTIPKAYKTKMDLNPQEQGT